MAKVTEFIKETRAELKHVAWPSRKQTVQVTALVIAVSLFVALFLTLFDWLFSLGLKTLIS
ncbi:MAG TPA: preprotein translocase subunit SecE [Candidatus Paceibacterota bacterium]